MSVCVCVCECVCVSVCIHMHMYVHARSEVMPVPRAATNIGSTDCTQYTKTLEQQHNTCSNKDTASNRPRMSLARHSL